VPVEAKSGETFASDFLDGIRYWKGLTGRTDQPAAWCTGRGLVHARGRGRFVVEVVGLVSRSSTAAATSRPYPLPAAYSPAMNSKTASLWPGRPSWPKSGYSSMDLGEVILL